METMNYEIFKTLTGNRDIDLPNVRSLVKSIRENGYIGTPILVSQNFEVLDGQHRLEALKQLGLPVPYEIREMDLSQVQALNSASRKWSQIDYIRSYASMGFEEYILLLNYVDKLGIANSYLICVLDERYTTPTLLGDSRSMGGGHSSAILKAGKFVCYNESFITFYQQSLPKLTMITPDPKTGKLFIALAWCYRFVPVPPKELIDRMMQFRHMFENGFPAHSLFIKAMQDAWNYNREKKNHVNFFERGMDRCANENNMKFDLIKARKKHETTA